MVDFAAAIAKAAEQSPNMNEAQSGGDFEREIPAAGLTRLRLVGYVELGVQADEYQGKPKNRDKVALTFELSGPKHPPIELNDGRKVPHIITITESLSLNEKANFFKLFKRMNHTGEFTHMAQMLGREFLGTVVHVEKGEGDKKRTYANLRDEGGYTIRPPFVDDPETGESRRITVDEPQTPLKCFLWNFATKEMWDSIFIDGRWPDKTDESGKVVKEGASKNYWQNTIRAALNFKGSPMAELLFAGGEPDLPEAETPERKPEAANDTAGDAAGDPLADVA